MRPFDFLRTNIKIFSTCRVTLSTFVDFNILQTCLPTTWLTDHPSAIQHRVGHCCGKAEASQLRPASEAERLVAEATSAVSEYAMDYDVIEQAHGKGNL